MGWRRIGRGRCLRAAAPRRRWRKRGAVAAARIRPASVHRGAVESAQRLTWGCRRHGTGCRSSAAALIDEPAAEMLAAGARRPLQARRLDGEHRLGITRPERSQPIETGDQSLRKPARPRLAVMRNVALPVAPPGLHGQPPCRGTAPPRPSDRRPRNPPAIVAAAAFPGPRRRRLRGSPGRDRRRQRTDRRQRPCRRRRRRRWPACETARPAGCNDADDARVPVLAGDPDQLVIH